MESSASQKRFALIAAILASSMAFIDGTALNVAMPALQKSLQLSGAQLLWVVNSYTLFLAALMLAGGALGDIYGKRKVFLWGIGLFTLSSVGCGFSPDGWTLIVMRGIQGVGGALMVPGSLSLISAVYPTEERGGAIGTWSMFSAFTTILGPLIGGYLAGQGWWRAIFFINVPLGLVSAFLLIRYVREPARAVGKKLDIPGVVFVTLGATSLVYGLLQGGEYGFDRGENIAFIVAGIVFLIAFIWQEQRSSHPMMPLGLFRSSTFSAANGMTLMVYGALGVALFFLPLNLIQVQGYSEQMAGLAVLPFGGLIAILARVSGKWTDRFGPKVPLIVGPILTGMGFWGFSWIGQTEGAVDFATTFLPVLALSGLGMGITVVPLTTAVMLCVKEQDTGIASGINNTVARLAGVVVLSILGAIALILFQQRLENRLADSSLSVEQQAYMAEVAADLAAAEPAEDWSEPMQNESRAAVRTSFIAMFDDLVRWSAILCWIGAVISAVFVRRQPAVVSCD